MNADAGKPKNHRKTLGFQAGSEAHLLFLYEPIVGSANVGADY